GLIERLKKQTDSGRRRECADVLTRVYKKPATPWVYWGFRPAPRPANVMAWERTDAIETALNQALADSERAVRLPLLRRMLREKVPARTATLGRWPKEDRTPESAAALLAALGGRPAGQGRPHCQAVL